MRARRTRQNDGYMYNNINPIHKEMHDERPARSLHLVQAVDNGKMHIL